MIRAILIIVGLLLSSPSLVFSQQRACPVPSHDQSLNVLTLNLLFSEYPKRLERLAEIARFIADNNIHIIALQEVVGGQLDRFVAQKLGGAPVDGNTARELRNLLRKEDLQCDLRTGFATGIPQLYEVSNATLVCGCQFTGNRILRLLRPANERVRLAGLDIRLTRSVLMTRLDTVAGSLNIYNTHLCSLCNQEERAAQATEALNFIAQLETLIPADHVLFLGDFNTTPAGLTYAQIAQSGFTDTYLAAKELEPIDGIDPSCTPDNTEGCTIGVSGIRDPLLGPTFPPLRIDYIFDTGPWKIDHSRVVFNPLATGGHGPAVSDHSGVVTWFGPP